MSLAWSQWAAPRRRRLALAGLLGAALAAGAAAAQTPPAAAPVDAAAAPMATAGGAPMPAPAPAAAEEAASQSLVINLMRLLVKNGVITQDAADQIRQEAEDETQKARAAAAASAQAGSEVAAQVAAAPPAPGVIRIPYVPQVVRNEIKEDIKKDVMAQAQAEGWASPGAFPEWTSRIQWFGDIRFRDQFNLYSANNVSPFIDYATFNASGPTDINANTNPNGLPFLNTRQDRLNLFSVRVRAGMNVNVFNGVKATIRLASGSDTGPVSTTQYLGGGLTKKNFWLDQAYITLSPNYWSQIILGRQPDIFMHTNLLFDDNLNFDGATVTATRQIGPQGLQLFATGGAYPIDYVPQNFPNISATKTGDSTKWLFAGQIGAQYQRDPLGLSVRGAVAFYDFYNVAGQLSAPCDTWNNIKQCSTDASRPTYMQKGNTLFLIRNITPNPASPLNYAQPQFVGLSYDYRELDVTGEVEFPMFGVTRGLFQADYVRNLAYDPGRILANPATPPVTNFDQNGGYRSGPNGWMARFTYGYTHPGTKGDWNVVLGYKYTEPDAVIDAFNDNDFGLGGTNSKGYFIHLNYYFANNTWLSGKWYSANEVFGPPLAIDVLQLELNTKF